MLDTDDSDCPSADVCKTAAPGANERLRGAPPRLYQVIARQIDEMISAGGFAVGDRLPSERELAHRFGVSRPSVREAVIALEVAGVVEVRTGSGVYVRLPEPPRGGPRREFAGTDLGPGPYEALEVRQLLEGEAAFRAATRLDADGFVELRASIEAMRSDPSPVPSRGDVGDRAFHELIAAASGNGVLAMMVRELWDARASPLWRRWIERTRTAAMHRERVEEHERIAERLIARDAGGARAAMVYHIDQVARRFAGG